MNNKIAKKVGLLSICMGFSLSQGMETTRSLAQPPLEKVMKLAGTGLSQLSHLALSHTPAAVNFGIYNIINRFKSPAFIIFGSEAAILITLSCTQGDPMSCLSSFLSAENLQAVGQVALENLSTGATYALGEEVARKAIALAEGKPERQMAQTLLTTLSASGIGFYAWSMDPSMAQSMILSACSATLLTALTNISNNPSLQQLQKTVTEKLYESSTYLGDIMGVATIAAGTAAVAYWQGSAKTVLNTIINASTQLVSTQTLKHAQSMIRANASWISGYRWSQNMFKQISYSPE